MEGSLDVQGAPGGAWASCRVRLDDRHLDVYDAGDGEEPRWRLVLCELWSVAFDDAARACLVSGKQPLRLRGFSDAETRRWTKAIQDRSGMWFQFDTVVNLPKSDPACVHTIYVGWSDCNLQAVRGGELVPKGEQQDWILRQQIHVVSPQQKRELLLTLRRASPGEGGDRLVGQCKTACEQLPQGKLLSVELFDRRAQPMGASISMKVCAGTTVFRKGGTGSTTVQSLRGKQDDIVAPTLPQVARADPITPAGEDREDREDAPGPASKSAPATVRSPVGSKGVFSPPSRSKQERKATVDSAEQVSCSTADARTESEVGGGSGARAALDAIADLLDEKRLRLVDLFRHPEYNPSYTEGSEVLGASDLAQLLSAAGLELSVDEARALVDRLDRDGGGSISIDELEAALRMHRRGTDIWETEEFKKRRPGKKAQRSMTPERGHQLYQQHRERLARLHEKKALIEAAEQAQIEKEKQELRAYCGKSPLVAQDDGALCHAQRLYQDSADREQRWHKTKEKYELEERAKLEDGRCKLRASSSAPQLATHQELKAHVARLHKGAASIQEGVRVAREAQIATELLDLDLVGKKKPKQSRQDVYSRLHENAASRAKRMQALKQHLVLREDAAIEDEVQRRRAKIGAKPLDELRIRDLHKVGQVTWEKREVEARKKEERELQKIAEEAAKARADTAATLKHCRGKVMAALQKEKASPVSADHLEALARMKSPMGFGSTVARRTSHAVMRRSVAIASTQMAEASDRRARLCRTTVEPAEHAIRAINAAVCLRAACVPEDAPEKFLHSLAEPMRQVLRLFRDAAEESERGCDSAGFPYLRLQPSQRIYASGALLEDPRGWHECTEPMPICQLRTDLDEVMEAGARAHLQLLARVGPGEKSPEAADVSERWPAGAKWNSPKVTRKAMFAYNPGPKTRESAETKAFVRYAPADDAAQYRHLLDIARVALVFKDAAMLRQGLEQVLAQFEVLAVQNYYHSGVANLLGDKFVCVYVVVVLEGDGTPHVGEIRLEEHCFHMARREAERGVEGIAGAFCQQYQRRRMLSDGEGIKYLVRHLLSRPKDSHSLTVFRRHLARHFGSTVIAWRHALGNAPRAPFLSFREVCAQLASRPKTTEYWEALDSGFAGTVSLFELDPEAVVLLARFYARLMGLVRDDGEADVETLFTRLTSATIAKPNKPGRLEAHEFRAVLKVLGFDQREADCLFRYLDGAGGVNRAPPATVSLLDIAWLKRLPQLVDIDSVMLTPSDAVTMVESLRLTAKADEEKHRRRIPRAKPSLTGAGMTFTLSRSASKLDNQESNSGDEDEEEEEEEEDDEASEEEDAPAPQPTGQQRRASAFLSMHVGGAREGGFVAAELSIPEAF